MDVAAASASASPSGGGNGGGGGLTVSVLESEQFSLEIDEGSVEEATNQVTLLGPPPETNGLAQGQAEVGGRVAGDGVGDGVDKLIEELINFNEFRFGSAEAEVEAGAGAGPLTEEVPFENGDAVEEGQDAEGGGNGLSLSGADAISVVGDDDEVKIIEDSRSRLGAEEKDDNKKETNKETDTQPNSSKKKLTEVKLMIPSMPKFNRVNEVALVVESPKAQTEDQNPPTTGGESLVAETSEKVIVPNVEESKTDDIDSANIPSITPTEENADNVITSSSSQKSPEATECLLETQISDETDQVSDNEEILKPKKLDETQNSDENVNKDEVCDDQTALAPILAEEGSPETFAVGGDNCKVDDLTTPPAEELATGTSNEDRDNVEAVDNVNEPTEELSVQNPESIVGNADEGQELNNQKSPSTDKQLSVEDLNSCNENSSKEVPASEDQKDEQLSVEDLNSCNKIANENVPALVDQNTPNKDQQLSAKDPNSCNEIANEVPALDDQMAPKEDEQRQPVEVAANSCNGNADKIQVHDDENKAPSTERYAIPAASNENVDDQAKELSLSLSSSHAQSNVDKSRTLDRHQSHNRLDSDNNDINKSITEDRGGKLIPRTKAQASGNNEPSPIPSPVQKKRQSPTPVSATAKSLDNKDTSANAIMSLDVSSETELEITLKECKKGADLANTKLLDTRTESHSASRVQNESNPTQSSVKNLQKQEHQNDNEDHNKTTKVLDQYKCLVCDIEAFTSAEDLRCHHQQAHPPTSFSHTVVTQYECGVCGKPFELREDALVCAVLAHDPTSLRQQMFRYACSQCPKDQLRFHSVIALQKHWEVEHGHTFQVNRDNPPEDDPLPTVIVKDEDIKRIKSGELPIKSEFELVIERTLETGPHEKTTEDGGTHIHYCTVCNAKLNTNYELNNHMLSHAAKPPPKPIYKCNKCPLEFNKLPELRQHFKIHLTSPITAIKRLRKDIRRGVCGNQTSVSKQPGEVDTISGRKGAVRCRGRPRKFTELQSQKSNAELDSSMDSISSLETTSAPFVKIDRLVWSKDIRSLKLAKGIREIIKRKNLSPPKKSSNGNSIVKVQTDKKPDNENAAVSAPKKKIENPTSPTRSSSVSPLKLLKCFMCKDLRGFKSLKALKAHQTHGCGYHSKQQRNENDDIKTSNVNASHKHAHIIANPGVVRLVDFKKIKMVSTTKTQTPQIQNKEIEDVGKSVKKKGKGSKRKSDDDTSIQVAIESKIQNDDSHDEKDSSDQNLKQINQLSKSTPRTKYQCKICKKFFRKSRHLLSHDKNYHTESEKEKSPSPKNLREKAQKNNSDEGKTSEDNSSISSSAPVTVRGRRFQTKDTMTPTAITCSSDQNNLNKSERRARLNGSSANVQPIVTLSKLAARFSKSNRSVSNKNKSESTSTPEEGKRTEMSTPKSSKVRQSEENITKAEESDSYTPPGPNTRGRPLSKTRDLRTSKSSKQKFNETDSKSVEQSVSPRTRGRPLSKRQLVEEKVNQNLDHELSTSPVRSTTRGRPLSKRLDTHTRNLSKMESEEKVTDSEQSASSSVSPRTRGRPLSKKKKKEDLQTPTSIKEQRQEKMNNISPMPSSPLSIKTRGRPLSKKSKVAEQSQKSLRDQVHAKGNKHGMELSATVSPSPRKRGRLSLMEIEDESAHKPLTKKSNEKAVNSAKEPDLSPSPTKRSLSSLKRSTPLNTEPLPKSKSSARYMHLITKEVQIILTPIDKKLPKSKVKVTDKRLATDPNPMASVSISSKRKKIVEDVPKKYSNLTEDITLDETPPPSRFKQHLRKKNQDTGETSPETPISRSEIKKLVKNVKEKESKRQKGAKSCPEAATSSFNPTPVKCQMLMFKKANHNFVNLESVFPVIQYDMNQSSSMASASSPIGSLPEPNHSKTGEISGSKKSSRKRAASPRVGNDEIQIKKGRMEAERDAGRGRGKNSPSSSPTPTASSTNTNVRYTKTRRSDKTENDGSVQYTKVGKLVGKNTKIVASPASPKKVPVSKYEILKLKSELGVAETSTRSQAKRQGRRPAKLKG